MEQPTILRDGRFVLSKKRKPFKEETTTQNESGTKMEKTDKTPTKATIVAMQVIDQKGQLVGKVTDVTFAVGKTGIILSVENEAGKTKEISWDEVQAASDFILLKPTLAPTQTFEEKATEVKEQVEPKPVQPEVEKQSTKPLCPTCGRPLTWIPKYKRWYCYNDKKYV